MHSNYRSSSPPPPSSPRSPTSAYAITTSRSHTGIGGASGILSSSDDPYSQGYSVRRSPTSSSSRSTFSPPRVPLFEDLPPHLYSRYSDSQDYLTRHSRNTFSRRPLPSSTATLPANPYLSPSSGYSPSTRDWNSPSSATRSYGTTSPDPSNTSLISGTPSPYSVSPFSTKSLSPSRSLNSHTVHEPVARPLTPVAPSSPSRLQFESSRPFSPVPVVFVRPYDHMSLRDEIFDPSEHFEVSPGTQQLIQESQAITRELDNRVDQSDRFMQEMDEKLNQLDKSRQERGSGSSPHPARRPRSWIVDDEDREVRKSSRERHSNVDDVDPKNSSVERSKRHDPEKVEVAGEMSVLEVEIADEDDLIKALRKSAERMTSSPKKVEKTHERRTSDPKTESVLIQRSSVTTSSAGRFEDTVSSYELRKREEKKPSEESVLKKYMPQIIGAAIVLFVMILLITSMKGGKNKPVTKKIVKEAANDVLKDSRAVKSTPKHEEKLIQLRSQVVTKSPMKKELKLSNVETKVLNKTTKAVDKGIKKVAEAVKETNKAKKATKGSTKASILKDDEKLVPTSVPVEAVKDKDLGVKAGKVSKREKKDKIPIIGAESPVVETKFKNKKEKTGNKTAGVKPVKDPEPEKESKSKKKEKRDKQDDDCIEYTNVKSVKSVKKGSKPVINDTKAAKKAADVVDVTSKPTANKSPAKKSKS